MVVRFIDNGTLFDISLSSEIPGFNVKLKGSLYEVVKNTVLLLEGSELYDYCADKPAGMRFNFVFFRGPKEYSFLGKFERVFTRDNYRLTEFSAISSIEERNRRTMPRLEVSVPVKLYAQTEHNARELVCEGQSVDISFDAICFLSNDKIEVADNSRFFIEFTLHRYDKFTLPASLVRKGNAPQTVQYKYDYAFIFDFAEHQSEKSRMLTAFFQSRLDSQR